jgi:hypothetical protein
MNDSTIRISSSNWDEQHTPAFRFDLIPGAFRSTLLNYSHSR